MKFLPGRQYRLAAAAPTAAVSRRFSILMTVAGGFAVCAAGLRRSRLSGYGDNSEIARKSADADERHHNFCSVVPVRFRRDGVREIYATA
jgi:hypothetical protein